MVDHKICIHFTKVLINNIFSKILNVIYLISYWPKTLKSYCILHSFQCNCNVIYYVVDFYG
jgi:hypothetical protein